MAKPFSIQSPEDIAKEYAGNKQKIAQAMQLGVVDPTAGVLAGMFIDRMRAGQMQEGMPQSTVAQQVMGGAPPAAPVPPLPAGGLGATPQAAPPMTPEMGMAPPMPQEAPMGMAMGGLATLPVPDAMFDEPTNGGFNDGYAGGGIVAFSDGGGASLGSWIEEQATSTIPGIVVTSRQRSAAKNREVGGAANSYHRTDKARDFVPPKGMDMGGLASKLKSIYGAGFDIINEGDHVHVEPGPQGSRNVMSTPREADLGTASGRAISLEDARTLSRDMLAGLPREELERARSYALEELDPANQEKTRKADMWQALAEMGFRMASSNTPFLLQAIGEAATATLPGVDASKKERKAAKDNAIRTLMAVEDVDRKTATAGVELSMNIYKSGMDQEQFKEKMAFNERELESREAMAREERSLRAAALEFQKTNRSQFEQLTAAYRAANPGVTDVDIFKKMRDDGLLGNAAAAATYPGDQSAQESSGPWADYQ